MWDFRCKGLDNRAFTPTFAMPNGTIFKNSSQLADAVLYIGFFYAPLIINH
jgi:hypothetical protein